MPDERPWGFSVFCDDLRQEVDGKRTLVGAYMAAMNVTGTLPASLPKLAIAVTFFEPHAAAATRDWEMPLCMIMPGETFDTAAFRIMVPPPPPEVLDEIKKWESEEPNP